MSAFTIPYFYSNTDKFFLKENGVMMAFAVEGYLDRKTKDDPRYVKYIARVVGVDHGHPYEQILPVRKCTEADYEKFSEID